MAWIGSHTAGVASGGRKVAYYIKTQLKLAGWEVTASGDGAGNYSTFGDVITSSGTGANGVDNASSWFCMKKYCQLTEQWRHFSYQNSNTLGNIAVFDSHTAGFTGGSPSATRRQPATDEKSVKGGGTDASPSYTSAWASDMSPYTIHVMADEESASWISFASKNAGDNVGVGGLGLDILRVGEDDPDPYAWLSSATSARWAAPQNDRTNYKGWQGRGTANESWKVFGAGSGGYSGLGFQTRDNPWTAKWQLFPMSIADSAQSDTLAVFKGHSRVWRLCGHYAVAGATDDRNPTTLNVEGETRNWVTYRGRAFPWDGTSITGEHGNYDGEFVYFDLQQPYTPSDPTPTPPPTARARTRAALAGKVPTVKKVPRVPIAPGGDPERAIEPLRQTVNQLIESPALNMRVIPNVDLDDGVETEVVHGLGRKPIGVIPFNVRGADTAETGGRIDYIPSRDESRSVTLYAIGHGATVQVDLLVF